MNTDSIITYKLLVGNSIYLPEHFRKRYKERVSKSSKGALEFAKKSYLLGKDPEQIADVEMRDYLQKKSHGYTCKVYRGFVCWFWFNRAITVYRIPILNKKGDCYEKNYKYR